MRLPGGDTHSCSAPLRGPASPPSLACSSHPLSSPASHSCPSLEPAISCLLREALRTSPATVAFSFLSAPSIPLGPLRVVLDALGTSVMPPNWTIRSIGLYQTGLSLQVQVGTVFTTRSCVLKEGSRDVLVKGAVDLHLEAWVGRPAPASFLASDLSWSRRSSSSLRLLTDKMKLIITKLLTADI